MYKPGKSKSEASTKNRDAAKARRKKKSAYIAPSDMGRGSSMAPSSSKTKAKPSSNTTRSGKEITNKKVIAKRKANQGTITNKKRAATLGQAPKNKLRAKKMAAGEAVKSKLSGAKQKRIASGVTKAAGSKKLEGGTAVSARGKTVTNRKRAAKINSSSGNVTNKLRARKLAGKKTKTRG